MSAPPLASALLRGGICVAAGAAGCRLLQALGWFLLARQLDPADVGALTVAAVFVNALALLPGMGLGTALLARRDDPRPLAPSALSLALGGGVAVALVAQLVGELVGRSHGHEVGQVIRWLGLSLPFQGAGSVACALLDRELRFKMRAIAETSGGVAFVVVAVAAAAGGMRGAAPALGLAASAAVTAIVACAAARLLPARRPDLAALRATSRVGAIVLATALLQWLFVSADVWIIEQRFGRVSVGRYGIALQLALLPATTLGLFLQRLALPALVRARAEGLSASDGFERATRFALLLGAAATTLLALAAGPLVKLLYGERFAAASLLVPPLAIYAFARVLGGLGGPALLATGRARSSLLLVAAQDLVAIPVACLLPAALGARGTALTFALATAAAGFVALRVGTRALREGGAIAPPRLAPESGGPAR